MGVRGSEITICRKFCVLAKWMITFVVLHEMYRSSRPEVFLRKGQIYRRTQCSNFTEEHPCWSVISIKSLCNFIEIALWHWCSSVNLLHIFRTPFPKNTSWWLLLNVVCSITLFEKGTTELKWFFSCLEICN